MFFVLFFVFFVFSLISWSQRCKLFFQTIKVKWRRWAESEGFGLSWLSEWASKAGTEARGREYKLDAYVSDMMANKKWVLVRVSTGAILRQPNENWLSIEKQWQIKWAIKSTARGRKTEQAFPAGIKIIALNL